MTEHYEPITNLEDAEQHESFSGEHFGSYDKILTPGMRAAGGKLGVVQTRVPPGRTACPFHTHQLEDEVFFIQSGRGVLRYGERIYPLRAGDCVALPAGTGVAHQLANDGDEDLVYLSIGNQEPNEVCTYPDSGKVMVRSLKAVGVLEKTPYDHNEPVVPKIFGLASEKR